LHAVKVPHLADGLLQDCGKPFYTSNYIALYNAIIQRYPHMRLIANCEMGNEAPTDIWDW